MTNFHGVTDGASRAGSGLLAFGGTLPLARRGSLWNIVMLRAPWVLFQWPSGNSALARDGTPVGNV
jgi:hypothetical protein